MIKKVSFLTALIPVLIAAVLSFSLAGANERVGVLKQENKQLKARLSFCKEQIGDCEKRLRRQNRRDERRER